MKESGHDFNEITLVGGGSKNKLWTKIISSVLNVDIYKLDNEQGPSFGACILAMVGSGYFPDLNFALKKLINKQIVEKANPELVEKYNKKYKKYAKIYYSLKLLEDK